MKIGWVEIVKKRYGGSICDKLAQGIISRNFDFELISVDAKYLISIFISVFGQSTYNNSVKIYRRIKTLIDI